MDTKRDLVQRPLTAAAASDTDGLTVLFKKKKIIMKIYRSKSLHLMPHGSATQCSKWRSDIKFHLVKKAAFFSHSQVAPSEVTLSGIVSETSDQITHRINEAQLGLRAQNFGCSQCVFSEVKRVMLVSAVEHLSLRALLLSGAAMETKRTLCSVHTLRRATSSRRTVAPTGSKKDTEVSITWLKH